MKKHYELTREEFGVIQEAIGRVLNLETYDFISAEDKSGGKISMSKKTFFDGLEREFIIKG